MRLMLQILFVALTACVGFMVGALTGARLVADKTGMAGSAVVAEAGLGGFVLALAAGVVLARRLRPAALRIALLVVAVLAALSVVWVGSRVSRAQAATPEHAATSSNQVARPRYPILTPAELPMGLGIAGVTPRPGGVLYFHREPRVGELPGDYPPSDSLRFGPGQPYVDIAEAPPWLVPEHLKLDYELLQFRVLTLTRDWVEVIGNSRTGQSWWVDRSAVQFSAWPEFLLGVHSVDVLDVAANPVRARPLDAASILASASAPLPPLAVRGDWLNVSIHHLGDRMPPDGWIRWRRGDRLLVRCNPLS